MKIREALENIAGGFPNRVVISNPRSKSDTEYRRLVFEKKIISKTTCYQIEKYTEKQVFHENIGLDEWTDRVCASSTYFKQINIFSDNEEREIKINRAGDCLINKRTHVTDKTPSEKMLYGNNRKKEYIFEEGMNIPILVELGIFTKDFKVVNSKYDKFKQINRFVELVDDALKNYHNDEINIIDFGCGKSYLTFVLYHYLKRIKGINAHIVGLDLKKDVIEKCNKWAEAFGYKDLRFEVGDINGYKADFRVDMVITLHACDTATDYALFNAIQWDAGIIMSVPCCQHEINKQIKSDNLRALTKYGLLKDRVSAIITDAIRGCVLEYAGYSTDLVEFIDIEHSPKNLMIRSVKVNMPDSKKKKSLEEAKSLCEEFGIEQTLMKKMNLV